MEENDLGPVAAAIRRFEAAGFTAHFVVQEGRLVDTETGVGGPPEEFHIVEVVRDEGFTDPDDESAVFALIHLPSGLKGTYTVAYGPEMDPADAEMAARLDGMAHPSHP